MKKVAKKVAIGVGVPVGALVIAIIVLCSVSISPMKSFMDYDKINVTASEIGYPLPNEGLKSQFGKKVDKNLNNKYSVMHAMLEFVYKYGPEFITVKNSDGKTVVKEVTITEAQNAVTATSDSYKIELKYDETKTFEVEGKKIKYDTLLMNVKNTESELRWVTVYIYESKYDGTQNVESEEYRVTPFRIRMNTTPIYRALGEIVVDPVWGGK